MNELVAEQQALEEFNINTQKKTEMNEAEKQNLNQIAHILVEKEALIENEEVKKQNKNNLNRQQEGRVSGTKINPILKGGVSRNVSDNDETNSSRVQQAYNAVIETILQRVRTSFDTMQDWEQQRTLKLNNHYSICENILQLLSARIAISTHGTEGILDFFTSRKNQIEYYCKLAIEHLTPLEGLFLEKSLKESGSSVLIKLLKEYDEFHLRQTQTNRKNALFIQNTIIYNLRSAHENASKLITSFELQIMAARKKINKINSQMKRKGTKYSNLVSKILNQGDIQSYKNPKDLYAKELSMISCAQKQTDVYQEFGREVVKFCKLVYEAENLRFYAVRQALSSYVELLTELHGNSYGEPEAINKLLKAFNVDNEIQNLFSLSSLLTEEDETYISKFYESSLKGQQLTNDEIENFLQNCHFEPPKIRPLVLKEWKVFIESAKSRSFKPYDVVLALGGNLLFIDRSDKKQQKKAEAIIKLSHTSVMRDFDSRNPHIVELTEIKPGFIIDTKKKYIIQFDKIDHIDEFFHCLDNAQHY